MMLDFSILSDFQWLVAFIPILAIPACVTIIIVSYLKNKQLKKQLKKITEERDNLIVKTIHRNFFLRKVFHP